MLDANPAEVERYRSGEEKDRKKLRGFFMGKVMAETKGRGNPQVLNRLLDETLAGSESTSRFRRRRGRRSWAGAVVDVSEAWWSTSSTSADRRWSPWSTGRTEPTTPGCRRWAGRRRRARPTSRRRWCRPAGQPVDDHRPRPGPLLAGGRAGVGATVLGGGERDVDLGGGAVARGQHRRVRAARRVVRAEQGLVAVGGVVELELDLGIAGGGAGRQPRSVTQHGWAELLVTVAVTTMWSPGRYVTRSVPAFMARFWPRQARSTVVGAAAVVPGVAGADAPSVGRTTSRAPERWNPSGEVRGRVGPVAPPTPPPRSRRASAAGPSTPAPEAPPPASPPRRPERSAETGLGGRAGAWFSSWFQPVHSTKDPLRPSVALRPGWRDKPSGRRNARRAQGVSPTRRYGIVSFAPAAEGSGPDGGRELRPQQAVVDAGRPLPEPGHRRGREHGPQRGPPDAGAGPPRQQQRPAVGRRRLRPRLRRAAAHRRRHRRPLRPQGRADHRPADLRRRVDRPPPSATPPAS